MSRLYLPKEKKVIFSGEESHKKLWTEGNLVYKTNTRSINDQWFAKMESILNLIDLPALVSFIPNGYVTKLLEGTDLHGNDIFGCDHPQTCIPLSDSQKISILKIFSDMIYVGEKLGYTLGDITCGNIIFSKEKFYLIDYNPIVNYPLPDKEKWIWSNTIKLVFQSNQRDIK